MNCDKPSFGQSGVALALSLLLLLVLTIVGVAAMNSTIMQERMSGNIQTQTQSFEVSAEGVGRALEYFHDHFGDIAALADHPQGLACGFVHQSFDDGDMDTLMAWRYPNEGFTTIYTEDGLRLEQQMYCCRSWAEVEIEGSDVWVENPSKLFVLSQGSFITGEGTEETSLARRDIEVRLDEAEPGEPTCAFCMPGEVGTVDAPESHAFGIDGACGAAISTQDPDGPGIFSEALSEQNKSNYEGGIVHDDDMVDPWGNPNVLAEFIFWIKLGLHAGDWDNTELGGYWEGDHKVTGNTKFGTEANPAITYFDGSVDMGGNVGGHGIMIIRDQAKWGGTPGFNGLIVVLGGQFNTGGGGDGGVSNPGGSIVSTNLIANYDPPDLLGREELRYPVSKVENTDNPDYDWDVEMHVSAEYPDGRPVLLTASDEKRYFIDYWQNHPDHGPGPFYTFLDSLDETGVEVLYEESDADPRTLVPRNSDVTDPNRLEYQYCFDGGGAIVACHDDSVVHDYRPRDRFGRLIPDFLVAQNWPPEEYAYSPNEWGWQLEDVDPADWPFKYGKTDLGWNGGGNQGFTYDCRGLQDMRHRLLCEEKQPGHDPDLDVDDEFYQEPELSDVCRHYDDAEGDGVEYNEDIENLGSALHNHHAWHLWNPSCDCLGITRDADMILAGWRENLGWRDDDFTQCQGLEGPP